MDGKRKPLATLNSSNVSEPPKKKHVVLTLQQKLQAIRSVENGSTVTKVSREYNIGRTTLLGFIKNRETIENTAYKYQETGVTERRTMKTAKLVALEEALYLWILQERRKKHILIPEITRNVYDLDVQFSSSNGWYDRFRKRYGLKMIGVEGERASANVNAFEQFKVNFIQQIQENRYEKWEIYNADESALFVKLLPSRTLVLNDEDIAEGRKVIKSRITFMPCCNIDGSNKLPLMFLGTSQNPRDLPKGKSDLPVYYKSSKKAWMNRDLFKQWFFEQFIPSVQNFAQQNGREPRALLLLDNCSAHHDGGNILESNDGKIKVIFLPPNVTSLGQPMDQGVLHAVKKRYKKKLMLHLLLDDTDCSIFEERLKKISLRQVIDWLHQSWDEISHKTIEGSWKNLLDEYPLFDLEEAESGSLDNDVLSLVKATAHFYQENPICDSKGNKIIGDCDVYTDNEILDSVLHENKAEPPDEEWLENSSSEPLLVIEPYEEAYENHQKSIDCVDFLIDLMDHRRDAAESIQLRKLRSKLIESEWQRRQR
ncbi:jerky protein homolog-like [Armigeres subalbatus]|uniref:jerky protein homolog-like n=1 Tax=Armigeres subalbatus TaxID=124917 RepID=UPI002ED452D2